MSALTQDLLAQLQGAPMQQIASQLGLDPAQATSAINTALPLLMGKLGSNAASAEGAQALLGALQTNHSGLDIGSVLGSVLGGGGGSAATNGAGILGHIFGGQQASAQAGVAQASGLSGAQSGQLMAMLAPLVMAYLGQRAGGQDASAAGLGQLLGQEHAALRQQGSGGGLLGMLDQDGDGQLGLGDVLKIGGGLLGGGGR